jgi:hypothetical protein
MPLDMLCITHAYNSLGYELNSLGFGRRHNNPVINRLCFQDRDVRPHVGFSKFLCTGGVSLRVLHVCRRLCVGTNMCADVHACMHPICVWAGEHARGLELLLPTHRIVFLFVILSLPLFLPLQNTCTLHLQAHTHTYTHKYTYTYKNRPIFEGGRLVRRFA